MRNDLMSDLSIWVKRLRINIQHVGFVTTNWKSAKPRFPEHPATLIRWIEKACRVLTRPIRISNIE